MRSRIEVELKYNSLMEEYVEQEVRADVHEFGTMLYASEISKENKLLAEILITAWVLNKDVSHVYMDIRQAKKNIGNWNS